jgi:hypothetical protein
VAFLKISDVPVGAVVADSLPFSSAGNLLQAQALKAAGVNVVVGYLGIINAARLGCILTAGMGAWFVTTAGQYDGAVVVKSLQALGLPKGVSVFLDLEGLTAFHADVPTLIAKINSWAAAILAAGFIPGLYVGSPQPLTSDEMWRLSVQRYWRGQGRIDDRNNALAEPTGGWSVTQFYPSVIAGGVLIDKNMVGQDYHGRVPVMVTA